MTDILTHILALVAGGGLGFLAHRRSVKAKLALLERLTDRDARGRFTRGPDDPPSRYSGARKRGEAA